MQTAPNLCQSLRTYLAQGGAEIEAFRTADVGRLVRELSQSLRPRGLALETQAPLLLDIVDKTKSRCRTKYTTP